MAFAVRKVKIRKARVKNEVGAIANLLAPIAAEGIDLETVVGYAQGKAKVCDVYASLADSGKKAAAAAEKVGLALDPESPALLVEGDNAPGVVQAIAEAAAGAGVNIQVCLGLSVGDKFAVLLGFADAAAADAAARKIRAAGAAKKPSK